MSSFEFEKAVFVNLAREENQVEPSELSESYAMLAGINLAELPQADSAEKAIEGLLAGIDTAFCWFGDGRGGWWINQARTALAEQRIEKIPRMVWLGGATAGSTICGLSLLAGQEGEQFQEILYRPLEIEDHDGKKSCCIYLAGFGHLSIFASTWKEAAARDPQKAALAAKNPHRFYLEGGVRSILETKNLVAPQGVIAVGQGDGETKSFAGCVLCAAEVTSLPVLGTLVFARYPLATNKVRLHYIVGGTKTSAWCRYSLGIVVGSLFGAESAVRLGLMRLFDAQTVSLQPDPMAKINSCLDGELRKLEGDVVLRRAGQEQSIILPNELIARCNK